LIHSDEAANLYTVAMLRSLMKHAGIEETAMATADALWVSVCDPTEVGMLVKARVSARGRPVIMGGFEAFFGEPYLAWADAVVVGEGWEFIRAWGQDPAAAMNLPCVLTKDREARASYDCAFDLAPLLKVPGDGRYYYLGGRGCHRKCLFCATGWTQPNQHNQNVRAAISQARSAGGRGLTIIGNDGRDLVPGFANAKSVTVHDYLMDPEKYKSPMVHLGIEGWTQDDRKLLGKPISDVDIGRLFAASKWAKQKMELFLIVGYPGWDSSRIGSLLAAIPTDAANGPSVHFKTTYFDPCPHTPLSRSAVSDEWLDCKQLFRELNSNNKRIRVFPTRSKARSAWRTAFHRCSPDEACALGPEPKDTNTSSSMPEFRRRLRGCGLESKVYQQVAEPCARVHVSPRGWADATGKTPELVP